MMGLLVTGVFLTAWLAPLMFARGTRDQDAPAWQFLLLAAGVTSTVVALVQGVG